MALDCIRNGRLLLYPAEVLLNTDLLRSEIFRMVDTSMLARSIIGGWSSGSDPSAICGGLNATPTVSPAFSVTIAPGVIYQYEELDATDYPADGTGVAADTTNSIYKQGINLNSTILASFNPSGTPGESIAYLIQATLLTSDTESTTRQYYNPSNPSTPITTAANDIRTDTVSLSKKASSSAVSPVTPTPDAGHIGLWVVTVPNGASVINSGMITSYSSASFLSETLPQKLSYTKLQSSAPIYGLDSSVSANTLTVTATPAYTEIVAGTHVYVKAANTNTGASTLNISGLGSSAIRSQAVSGLAALSGGEIITGVIYDFLFDGTFYQLMNPSNSSSISASVYKTVTQNVAASSTALMAFGGVDFDPLSMWDSVNNSFLVPFAGKWEINCSLTAAANLNTPAANAPLNTDSLLLYSGSDVGSQTLLKVLDTSVCNAKSLGVSASVTINASASTYFSVYIQNGDPALAGITYGEAQGEAWTTQQCSHFSIKYLGK